jgi:hypothetical protein
MKPARTKPAPTDVLQAERAALLEALGAALRILASEAGYRKAEAQATIRGLRALHADLGGR